MNFHPPVNFVHEPDGSALGVETLLEEQERFRRTNGAAFGPSTRVIKQEQKSSVAKKQVTSPVPSGPPIGRKDDFPIRDARESLSPKKTAHARAKKDFDCIECTPIFFPEFPKDREFKRVRGSKVSVFKQQMRLRRGMVPMDGEKPEGEEISTTEEILPILENEKREIDVENRSRIEQMMPSEVMEARAEIEKSVSPELIEMLRRRGRERLFEPVRPEEPVHERRAPDGVQRCETESHGAEDVAKCAWMNPVVPSRRSRGMAVRFGLDGEILPHDATAPGHSGLFHHGAESDRPGYTAEELLALTRSSVPQQRLFALHTLAAVLAQKDARVLEHMHSCHLVLFLRSALDSISVTGVIESLEAISALVNQRLPLEDGLWITALQKDGDLLSQTFDAEMKEASEDLSVLDTVACEDPIRALVFISIVPRLAFLLRTHALSAENNVSIRIVHLLTIFAHHSRDVAIRIAECVEMIGAMQMALSPSAPEPLVAATLGLCVCLCKAGRAVSSRLIERGVIADLTRWSPTYPQYFCKVWEILARYGFVWNVDVISIVEMIPMFSEWSTVPALFEFYCAIFETPENVIAVVGEGRFISVVWLICSSILSSLEKKFDESSLVCVLRGCDVLVSHLGGLAEQTSMDSASWRSVGPPAARTVAAAVSMLWERYAHAQEIVDNPAGDLLRFVVFKTLRIREQVKGESLGALLWQAVAGTDHDTVPILKAALGYCQTMLPGDERQVLRCVREVILLPSFLGRLGNIASSDVEAVRAFFELQLQVTRSDESFFRPFSSSVLPFRDNWFFLPIVAAGEQQSEGTSVESLLTSFSQIWLLFVRHGVVSASRSLIELLRLFSIVQVEGPLRIAVGEIVPLVSASCEVSVVSNEFSGAESVIQAAVDRFGDYLGDSMYAAVLFRCLDRSGPASLRRNLYDCLGPLATRLVMVGERDPLLFGPIRERDDRVIDHLISFLGSDSIVGEIADHEIRAIVGNDDWQAVDVLRRVCDSSNERIWNGEFLSSLVLGEGVADRARQQDDLQSDRMKKNLSLLK